MRVSTVTGVITTYIEQSAMASGCGRGPDRDRGCDFVGERGSFEGDRDSSGARLSISDKGPMLCKRCEKTNITEKYWEKSGRPEWAQLVNTDTILSDDSTYASLSAMTHSGTAVSLTSSITK